MRCPHCQFDAPDWHTYCLRCHRSTRPDFYHSPRQPSLDRDQLVKIISSWSLTAVFVFGSVIMIRLIDWGGLLVMLHGTPPPSIAAVAPDPSATANRRQTASPDSRALLEPQFAVEDRKRLALNASTEEVESVRYLSTPLEELSAGGKMDLAVGAASPLPKEAAVSIEQVDTSPTSASGLLTIKSDAPSRIYIDGQYSGTTPRTVHLLAGEYQVRLVADGYLEWTSRIAVRQQQQVGLAAAMTRIEP